MAGGIGRREDCADVLIGRHRDCVNVLMWVGVFPLAETFGCVSVVYWCEED